MRKRPTLTVALAVAIAAAVVASAAVAGPTVSGPNGNTQSLDAQVRPKKLPKKAFAQATLKVTTKTTTTTNPTGVPVPAVHALIDFDKDTRLFTKGLPKCAASKIYNTSTEAALAACGKAKIGAGKATVLLPLGPNVFVEPTTVTAFNGQPQGGKPVVLLHTYGVSPVQTTIVLVGAVSNYNKQGFGPRLDLNIPPIAGGVGALIEFQATINKKFRYKGKKRAFVEARCTKGKMKARGTFTFKDGESLTAFSKQSCTPKP